MTLFPVGDFLVSPVLVRIAWNRDCSVEPNSQRSLGALCCVNAERTWGRGAGTGAGGGQPVQQQCLRPLKCVLGMRVTRMAMLWCRACSLRLAARQESGSSRKAVEEEEKNPLVWVTADLVEPVLLEN